MKKLALSIAALGILSIGAFAAEKIQSGPQPGQPMGAFDVVDVSGPNKGKQLCYY